MVNETLAFAEKHDVPVNSVEGFLRQIIGWREFIHATYEDLGVEMRNGNHWNHTRPLPDSFYDGTTGIGPIDDTIHRILETGYAHHIERLMVLGGFMFLCEIDPDDIYRWFMEMFVDAYDWVMVPNAYAMSQHCRWRADHDQTLLLRLQLHPQNVRLDRQGRRGRRRRKLGRNLGRSLLDLDRQTRRRTGEEPALGHDGEREQADGGGEDGGVSGGGRGVSASK